MTNPFDNISPRNKEKLLKFLEADIVTFQKNSPLQILGKNENILGIIIKGYIQIRKTDYNGNRIIIEELMDNQIFGSIISSLKSTEYDLIAKETTDVILIDYTRLFLSNESKDYYMQFIKNILKILTEKIEEKNERIELLTKKTIRNKLLKYFDIMSKKYNSKYIYLPFNFTDLADYLSIDRSAMSRELKYLKEEGFIFIKGKKITLLYEKDSSLYINFQ